MSAPRICDARHCESLNSSRAEVVSGVIQQLKGKLDLRAAGDVGCGAGYFSALLKSLGLVAVEETDGDLAAMRKLRTLLKPSGKMRMTIPGGRDAATVPWHRVYGTERLPKLLPGYEIEEQCSWVKKQDNRWYPASKEAALSFHPTSHPRTAVLCSYAVGGFVLRPSVA